MSIADISLIGNAMDPLTVLTVLTREPGFLARLKSCEQWFMVDEGDAVTVKLDCPIDNISWSGIGTCPMLKAIASGMTASNTDQNMANKLRSLLVSSRFFRLVSKRI